jgi:hypothetical protein
MTPVAGAVTPIAPLGEVEAEAAESEAEDDRAVVDRIEVELRAEDMVVGAVSDDSEAEAEAAESVGLGAAPEPFPEAETAPRSAAFPVAAAPPPVAVRVGAW